MSQQEEITHFDFQLDFVDKPSVLDGRWLESVAHRLEERLEVSCEIHRDTPENNTMSLGIPEAVLIGGLILQSLTLLWQIVSFYIEQKQKEQQQTKKSFRKFNLTVIFEDENFGEIQKTDNGITGKQCKEILVKLKNKNVKKVFLSVDNN